MGGRKVETEKDSPAGDRLRGIVCERSPVFIMKAANECDIKVPQRARGRREGRRLMSDGKGDEREAKERGNESRIKERRQNVQRVE